MMDNFISTVLGAFLATFGGIIGAIFSHHLTKKSALHNDKKKAYQKLLSLCEKVINIDSAKIDEFFNELSETRSYIMLYGNVDTKREYNKFYKIIIKERENPKYKELLRSQQTMIACAIKNDLGIADKTERSILKKLRMEENNNAD